MSLMIAKWVLFVTISGSAISSGEYDSEIACKIAASSYGPMAFCVKVQ